MSVECVNNISSRNITTATTAATIAATAAPTTATTIAAATTTAAATPPTTTVRCHFGTNSPPTSFQRKGGIDLDGVKTRFPDFGELLETGLEMDVLDSKIMTENPEACPLISQALNNGHALGVGTVETSAIACLCKQLPQTKNVFAVADQQDLFQIVKNNVRQELGDFVEEEQFVALFNFVVDVAGDENPHLQRLLDFFRRTSTQR